MTTIASPVELHAIEKRREEELEEARSIQNVMLPDEALHAGSVKISHAFQPVTEVGGDFFGLFPAGGRVRGFVSGRRVRERIAGGDVCGVGGRNAARSA
jgi:serine phosphatase RsbU (regulator of sigma subunit)